MIRKVRGGGGTRPRRRTARRRKVRHWKRRAAVLLLVVALVAAGWLVWPYWELSGQFSVGTSERASRLFGRPHVLEVGELLDSATLAGELEALGYRRISGGTPRAGEFDRTASKLRVHLRRFPTPRGWSPGGLLEVSFSGRRISRLAAGGRTGSQAQLEPPLVATFYGAERQDRRPVEIGEVPDHLIEAVLAAEDARFFSHPGLSLTGILRATWVNLRGGALRQGGSTLTQQLVKNVFLTHERTLSRKLREAVLALAVDLQFSKEELLEAYLNEIYWGSSGGVSLMGLGSAAWTYFGKHPSQLDLCESALLAGMIRSPGGYSPASRPERAAERRDWVLGRMVQLRWLRSEDAAGVVNGPLCYSPQPLEARNAAYFAHAAAAEAERRFGLEDLEVSGHVLLSTLDPRDQTAAEEAVVWGLEALEEGWEKGRKGPEPLQAALVSVVPTSGEVRAWVGGRSFSASQFDRVTRAHRQAGSAFKPVVYATAFQHRVARPSSFLEDAPLTVRLAGQEWSPRNSDSEYRGWVTARQALERSLNVPTARLAMETGLGRIVDTAHAMGIESRLQAVPALALGAFEVTPLELATVYATLAAGGVRPPVHTLEAVLDPAGHPVDGGELPPPRRVLSAQSAYLTISVLQGVLDRGTAASARTVHGLHDPLAGKTGTTNDRRDSWFGGFSPDRATLVWVGYDDNRTTRLSGARAALPIWSRFTWKMRPRGGFALFAQPPGVVTAVIDPETGALASDDCPQALTEVFLAGDVPVQACPRHGRPWRELDPGEQEGGRKGPIRWLKKVFGVGGGKAGAGGVPGDAPSN